ncbi:helix-turn-helix transcriptional regulator [Frankia sp. QA3]|uniref:helix-turn-helix transcriptional regulator n=1 Tax=Frankia sp. QA3 TaxID=710111 RepID=UPI0018DEE8BE
MRAAGMTHEEIAVEFARRYRLRPRAAYRVAHGWTQQQAADRINAHAARAGLDPDGIAAMSAPRLSELENWPVPLRRRPTPQTLALLAHVYGTSIHDLLDLDDREHLAPADTLLINDVGRDLSRGEADATGTGISPRTHGEVGPPVGSAGPGSELPARLAAAALIASRSVVGTGGPDEQRWRHETALPTPTPEVDRGVSSLGTRRITRPLDFIKPPSGSHLGADLPDHLRRRTARLRRLDDILGGGETYDLYRAEYEATSAIVQSSGYDEATGRALLSILAEQAQQAGWAAFDAGNQAEASRLYKESHERAVAAGDSPLAGNALAYLAYQTGETDRRAAVKLAIKSCQVAGPDAPSTVRALLRTRLAWAHANVGNAREVERALTAAEAALAEDDERPQPDWAAWVDHNEVSIMTGRCWAELRRPLRAVPVLERVLGSFDEAHARDKSLYLSWLADAYLTADEIEQAASVAGRVLDLSAGVASARPRQRIMPALRRLDLHRSLPRVRETLDQAKALGFS